MALLLMVLGAEDVSRVRLGRLSPQAVALLRHIRDAFGICFKLEPDPASGTVLAVARGISFGNISRRAL